MQALGRQSGRRSVNIWPGFVDGLATLLLVVIFVLMVFMVAQFFLSVALSGRDQALDRLRAEVSELADLLALERSANADLRINVAELSSQLQTSVDAQDSLSNQLRALVQERDDLASRLKSAEGDLEKAANRVKGNEADLDEERDKLDEALVELEINQEKLEAALAAIAAGKLELEEAYQSIEADKETIETQLAELAILKSLRDEMIAELADSESDLETTRKDLALQQELTDESKAQVALLNRQIAALRQQLASLALTLDEAEAKNEEQEVQIADLGKRLNVALANKVQELARYRSDFFGRLRESLGDRQDIRVVGDRFVFQSEVLFGSGSAELGEEGKVQLAQLAAALKEIAAQIPDDIPWVLRVDGHTDRNPIATSLFPSNWELSTARAISVVKFLISQGIPADHLAATGFGEFQPLDEGDDEIAFRRNRRIELKLTQR
ncbi:MAG: peptidoglycan -binding protein [Pseudomonadota bacterium]